ncbi:MAG: ATP-binding protein [Kiritimatiellae bacterium]|nr:ATP-binding protein [Kiritimatiellia bacterium]
MRFFDRKDEMALLRRIREESKSSARMTILKGRRRIGKTALLQEAYGDEDFLYFFVARKNEADLCGDFAAEISRYLGVTLPGGASTFESIFRFLLEVAQTRPFTLVIDEFQDFLRINESIFSSMQRDWDRLKGKARINLVVSGSINRMMEQIFVADQPLYGRATNEIDLAPFSTTSLKEILAFHSPKYSKESLLALWTLTGGVAKYVELLMDQGAYDLEGMVKAMVSDGSIIPGEGKVLLVDEFGKDYATYFSVLSLIAGGRTSRAEIQNVTGDDIGGYLTKLESEYRLIVKNVPFASNGRNRNMRYLLNDNFYRFWFRFICKYQALIELRAYERLRELIFRDYSVFSGKALEGYFVRKLSESGRYTQIGNWWNRKGESEIDIVAVDDLSRRIDFFEVKRDVSRYSKGDLQRKADEFLTVSAEFADYKKGFKGLSVEDM